MITFFGRFKGMVEGLPGPSAPGQIQIGHKVHGRGKVLPGLLKVSYDFPVLFPAKAVRGRGPGTQMRPEIFHLGQSRSVGIFGGRGADAWNGLDRSGGSASIRPG